MCVWCVGADGRAGKWWLCRGNGDGVDGGGLRCGARVPEVTASSGSCKSLDEREGLRPFFCARDKIFLFERFFWQGAKKMSARGQRKKSERKPCAHNNAWPTAARTHVHAYKFYAAVASPWLTRRL